jgi:hypothetical protein
VDRPDIRVEQAGGVPPRLRLRRLRGQEHSDLLADREKFGVRTYHCFLPPRFEMAGDIKFREQCLALGGVWDTRCVRDAECPFFQANTQTPNYRGACLNGYCEMPYGVQPRGFRGYRGQPLCQLSATSGSGGCALGDVAFRASSPTAST